MPAVEHEAMLPTPLPSSYHAMESPERQSELAMEASENHHQLGIESSALTLPGDNDAADNTPTHYLAEISRYEDKFWALLVIILQEYYYNPENCKIIVFDKHGIMLLCQLFTKMLVNTKILYLGSQAKRSLIEGNAAIFNSAQNCILFCGKSWLQSSVAYQCKQVIQLDIPDMTGRICRDRMSLVEWAGIEGRFITLRIPNLTVTGDKSSCLLRCILGNTVLYNVDLTTYSSLFSTRFYGRIKSSLFSIDEKWKLSDYQNAFKAHGLHVQNADARFTFDQASLILHSLHSYGGLLGLKLKEIVAADNAMLEAHSERTINEHGELIEGADRMIYNADENPEDKDRQQESNEKEGAFFEPQTVGARYVGFCVLAG
ncbi:hypothetical protein EJ08DRAFT_692470 [Tothia fuscella]|uniref:Uncharacterized protein n=1 Tax=Tothia fuscella TaxID=1048955 RepID=A0A9P4P0E5_9PEZI|nr:hypothetical protein EJ08DRAFT_692470 [Tothia fuscella]